MRRFAGLRQQFTFPAFVDAADERDIVLRHGVETDNREQRVLLRTADDHSRDDMENTDRLVIPEILFI